MLHIVNKSASASNALQSALNHAAEGVVLLIEDAVYAAARGDSANSLLAAAMPAVPVYALMPDLEARGLADRVLEGVKCIDYDGFVDLVVQHPNNQSWL